MNTKTQKAIAAGWECIDKGWWCKEGVGGVVSEHNNKWSAHPAWLPLSENPPTFRTMADAIAWLETEDETRPAAPQEKHP